MFIHHRELMTLAEFRDHVKTCLMIISCLCILAVTFLAISFVYEVHAFRRSLTTDIEQERVDVLSRMDQLLWKADTFLTIFSATNKNLDHGLTTIRVQVQQQAETNKKAVEAVAAVQRSNTEVMKDVVNAVADKHPSAIEEKPRSIAAPSPQQPSSTVPVAVVLPQPVPVPKALGSLCLPKKQSGSVVVRALKRLWPW